MKFRRQSQPSRKNSRRSKKQFNRARLTSLDASNRLSILRHERLEDRRMLAFDMTLSTAATANVNSATAAGTTMFTPTAENANLNWSDVLGALDGGNNVVVSSGSAGTFAGNITDTAGPLFPPNTTPKTLTLDTTSSASGNITLIGLAYNDLSSTASIVIDAAGNVSTGILTDGSAITPLPFASVSITSHNGTITKNTSGVPGEIDATSLSLSAKTGIGVSGTDLPIEATNLTSDTSSGNGNQFLSETGTAKLGSASALNAGTGTVTLDGGTLQSAAGNALASASSLTVNSPATFDLHGNNQTVAALNGSGTLTNSTGSVTFTDNTSGTDTFSGLISGALQVMKNGGGSLTLSNANTYGGDTTINSGTLFVNNTSGSGTGSTGTVRVDGGTLGGTGSVSAVIVQGGATVSPGDPTTSTSKLGMGQLSLSGTYTAQINGTVAGTDYDQLDVNGTSTLSAGTLALTLGYTPSKTDTYTLISGTGAVTGPIKVNGLTVNQGDDVLLSYSGLTYALKTSFANNDLALKFDQNPVINAGNYGPGAINVSTSGGDTVVKVGATTVLDEPTADLSTLTINGAAGANALTVDYTGGNPLPSGGLTFNGGGSGSLVVTGYSIAQLNDTYTATVPHNSGTVQVGAAAPSISYTGLSPLTLSGTAGDLVIDLSQTGVANPDVLVKASGTAGRDQISGSTFETTTFTNPSNSLTIDLGPDGDTITTQDMDAAFHPAGAGKIDPFIINGGVGGDTYNIQSTQDAGGGTYGTATAGLGIVGGSLSTVDVGNATNGVQSIGSTLNIENPPAANTIVVDNSADTTGRTATLSTFTPGTDGDNPGGGNADPYGQIVGLAPAHINYEYNDTKTITVDGGAGGNAFNVQATGATTTINAGPSGDTFNVSSTAPAVNGAGTLTGDLSKIGSTLQINGGAGTDTLNVSDYGAAAGQTYSATNTGGGATQILASDAAGSINYNVTGGVQIENLNLTGSSAGGNTYNINATTATTETTIQDGDAAAGDGGSTFNITGDNLSAANTFDGHGGKESFFLNVTTAGDSLGTNAVAGAPLTGVTINAGAGGGDTTRNQLIVTDHGNVPRFLNFAYQDSTGGDLDIEPQPGSDGLGGNSTLSVVATGVQTVIANNSTNNNYTTITGVAGQNNQLTVAELPTAAGDNANLLPNGTVAGSSVTAFLGGTPYLNSPPATIANSRPGVAGGGAGPDLLINGIPEPLTLQGGGPATNDQAIVYAASEGDLVDTGNAADIFGLGAGVLQAGFGAGNAFDLVSVNGATTPTFPPQPLGADPDTVVIDNSTGGIAGDPYPTSLVSVSIDPTTGFQPTSVSAAAAPNLIVDGGDEPATNPNTPGVADDFYVTPSANYNIQVNGNLPSLSTVGGVPQGDQLNMTFTGSANVSSDNASPPNVTLADQGLATPFGVKYSSIERVDVGPANGVVNLIGNNDTVGNTQNDYFKVVGGPDPLSPLASRLPANDGTNQFSLQIGGSWDPDTGAVGTPDVNPNSKGGLSAPIYFFGVDRINVSGGAATGFDSHGNALPDTSATAGINNLDITPWANNNAQNPGIVAPFPEPSQETGWGIETYYNQGAFNSLDGGVPNDLLTVNGVAGVSENMTVQPSAPEAGQFSITNAATGNSSIAVINYVNNTNIVVNGTTGAAGDNDTLTLLGTNPNNPGTSGNDTFDVDLTRAGTPGNELVKVTDTTNGNPLYNLQNFSNFSTLNINTLGGMDTATLVGRNDGSVSLNVTGGNDVNDTVNVPGVANASDLFQVAGGPNGSTNAFELRSGATGFTTMNLSGIGHLNFNGGGGTGSDSLFLYGTSGSDTFTVTPTDALDGSVNVGGLPTIGYAALGTTSSLVNFSGDTALNGENDSVAVIGTAADNAYAYTPGTPGTGNSGRLSLTTGGNSVNFGLSAISHLSLDAAAGTNTLTVTPSSAVVTPGAASGSGTVTATDAAGNALLPLTYSNIASATVSGTTLVIDSNVAGSTVAVAANGDITVTDNQNGTNIYHAAGYNAVVINASGSNSQVSVSPGADFPGGIAVNGNGGTTLSYTGDGTAAVAINVDTRTVQEGALTPVTFAGVGTVNVNGVNQIVSFGGAGADSLVVTPTSASTATVSANGTGPTYTVTTTNSITAAAAIKSLTIDGSASGAKFFANSLQAGVSGDVGVNDTPANLASLTFNGVGGNNSLTVDSSSGTAINAGIIVFNGGSGGGNSLTLSGGTATSDTYAPGPNGGQGTDTLTIGGKTETVSFNNLAPVTDSVATTAAGQFVVAGTTGNDAITVANNTVSVNNLESITFANKFDLTVSGMGGNDTFNVSPASVVLTGAAHTINVAGTAGGNDTLTVNGTAGADAIDFTPTTAPATAATITGVGNVTVSATGIGQTVVNGQGGNDTLTYTTPAGATRVIYTPGALPDQATVSARQLGGGADLMGLSFTNLGNSGSFSLTDAGGVRSDTLVVNGTAGNDQYNVSAAGDGSVQLVTNPGGTFVTVNITTPGVTTLSLNGLAGDDVYNIPGNNPYPSGILINGSPSANATVNFTGDGTAAVTVDMGARTVTEAGFAHVSFSGIARVNVSGGGQAVTVIDSNPDTNLAVTPTGAAAATVQANGASPVVNVSGANASGLVATLGAGSTLTVNGPTTGQTFTATNTTVQDGGNLLVNYTAANLAQLAINGSGGGNSLVVDDTTGPVVTPIVYNGGNGTGNSLTVTSTLAGGGLPAGDTVTSDTYAPGPATGQGTVTMKGTLPGPANFTQQISFSNLSPVTDNVAAPLTVNGTTGNDAITAGATANVVTVNNLESLTFANKTSLTLNGNGGNDTFNVSPAGITFTGGGGVTVNGTAGGSNLLTVNATGAIGFNPTGLGAGSVTTAGNPTLTFTGVPAVAINGENGNDALTVTTPVGGSQMSFTPGATVDSGTVTQNVFLGGTALPSLTYTNLGVGGSLSVATSGGGQNSDLDVHGTSSDNIFNVSATGVVQITNALPNPVQLTLPINTPGVRDVRLIGGAGHNVFNVPGNDLFNVGIDVQGGASGADIVNFIGDGTAPVTVNLAAQTVTETGFGPVTYSGVSVVNVNTGGAAITVVGAGNDSMSYTPTGSGAGTVAQAGTGTVIHFTNVASTFTLDPGAGTNSVTVNGTAGNDTIQILADNVPGDTQVGVNSLQQVQIVTADTQNLIVNGGTGNDVLEVFSTFVPVTIPITDVGGPGTDALFLSSGGTNGLAAKSDVYTPGAQLGSGTDTLTFPTATEVVHFANLAPVFDLVPGPLSVNGTNTSNAINYSEGFSNLANFLSNTPSATWGQVSVDGNEPIEFINKTTLTINGLAGNDAFNVNNPNTPTGLTAITVNGAAGADDTLTVNGTATTGYNPGPAAGAGNVTSAGPTVNFTNIASADIVGDAAGDKLTITPAAGLEVSYTTGATVDSGSLAFGLPFGTSLTPLAFSNLGGAGSLSISDAGGGVDVNGPTAASVFNVTAAGVAQIVKPLGANVDVTLPITVAAAAVRLIGHSGNDTFDVPGNQPFTAGLQVQGDAGNNTLDFAGDGTAPVTVDLGAGAVDEAGFGAVSLVGIQTANINTGGAALTVTGTTGADTIATTPTSTNSISVQAYSGGTAQNGQGGTLASLSPTGPVYHAMNVSTAAGGFAINGNGGSDTLYVEGTQNADTIDVNDATSGANAVLVAGLLTVNYNAALPHVEIDGLAGSDTINIAPSTTTSFLVDGGDPIGVVPGDTINLIHPPGPYQIFPGPTKDSGGLNTPGFQTVSWAHIESIINTGGGSPIITGTNGNDEITVIARDSSYNPVNPGVPNPLLDGVQDFTVSVNDGPDMLFVNTPNLFIDALSGNDDIVVQEPAPNQANWNVQVYVAGGAPASGANRLGDNIELENTGSQSITYNPNDPLAAVPPVAGVTFTSPSTGGGQFNDTTDTSTITATQFLFPGLYQSSAGGAENFIYAGDGGGDSLTYNTPAAGAGSSVVYTPGATGDAGAITGSENGGATLTPLTFSGLGAGNVSFTTSNAGRTDSLAVNGTGANDSFTVDAGSGTVHLDNQVPILTPGVANLTLNGLTGDNSYKISATAVSPQPYTTINVNGSGLADPDVLNLFGNGTGVTANVGGPTPSLVGGGLGTVDVTGVGVVNLNDGAGAVTVSGTTNPDTFNVTPTGTSTATVQANGVAPQLNLTAGSLTIGDTNPPDGDQVVVNGTAGNDTIGVARGATTTVTVNALLAVAVTTADATALTVASGLGTDTINVTGAAGPALTVLGGQTPATDTLKVTNTATAGNTTYSPGATNDSGSLSNTDGLINFGGIKTVNDTAGAATDTLTVNGTNGNDTITAAAIAAGNLAWVNAQAPIVFGGFGTLTLNGRFGNDSFVVSPVGLTGLTKINVVGNTGANNTVTVNGSSTAGNAIGYAATGPGSAKVTIGTAAPVVISGAAAVALNGQAGNNALTITTPTTAPTNANQSTLTPGSSVDSGSVAITSNNNPTSEVPLSFSDLGAGAKVSFANAGGTAVDSLTYNGTPGSDTFKVTPTAGGTIVLDNQIPVITTGVANLKLSGLGGSDVFDLTGALPYTTTTVDDGSIVNLTGATGPVTINEGDNTVPSNPSITGYGGTVTLIGVDAANVDAGGNTTTATDTLQNDNLVFTPTGATAGTFYDDIGSGNNLVPNTVFNIANVAGNFMVFNDPGGNADQVTLRATDARDLIEINQGSGVAQVLANNVTALLPVELGISSEILNVLGLGGQNTFQVIPAAGIAGQAQDNLLININGGSGTGANNALVIANTFGNAPAALPATSFVVDNRGQDLNSGTIRVFQSAVANPDINYANVQVVAPIVSGAGTPNGNLMIMGPDKNEPNDTQATATSLGSAGNIEVSNATVFANSSEFPGVPADQDYYSVTAQQTGTLDFIATFNLYNPALLPGGGQLNLQVLDAAGNVIANAAGGAAAFGAEGATANARIRIPVVAGQTYFVHVFGANANGSPNGAVVNGYNLSIVDTPTIVPFNLELSRSVPAADAGSPDTGDLPPNAPGDDTGRSQFDNVTKDSTPRIYLRLSDGIFLNDLPGNGTIDNPPVGVIPLPFSPNATTPGFRVAIFDGNNTQTPVGFASQVAGFPGLYEFDFTTPLADGVHNLTAEVQMVDPQKANETGFGGISATLSITVDTVPPPVSFGSTGVPNSGLAGGSDSGVPGQPATIVDRITNVSSPTLYGVAEANSIVKLYDDLNGDGVVDAGDVFLGQATAIPTDGTNADPTGQWRITSNVDLNNPNLGFPLDGLRNLLVTGEDLAGNVSAPQKLSIFVDTQGPQVNNIGITGAPSFPLFNTKTTPTPVASPTPLINSLDITFTDQPVRVGPSFVYPAVNPILATTTANYALVGENNGIIPITSVTIVDNTTSGTPGNTTVTLHFPAKDTPLPDDRYTLTVSDAITDNAGNALQGSFNGTTFPTGVVSGNGSQGQMFVGPFTVNSRAHIGNTSSGTVALDINGNGIFDPQNSDANNRDAIITMGYPTDRFTSGNFSTSYGGTPVPGTANGFEKLAAYGQDANGNFRWMYDLSGTGGATTSVPEPFAIDGLPVAGNFAGSPLVAGSNPPVTTLGDQVGLFDGKAWYLDVLDNGYISAADLAAPATAAHPAGKLTSDMAGLPFVGNFDGYTDLGTYQNGVLEFDLASLDPGHIVTGQWNVKVNVSGFFSSIPFNYVTARPVAGYLNGLGQESSLGFYVPDGTNANPGTADWYFLEPTNSSLAGAPPVPAAGLFTSGTVTTANATDQAILQTSGSYFFNIIHQFKDQPLGGNDVFYQFGNQFALPVVGLWDPPGDGGLTTGSTPSPTVAANYVTNLYTQILARQASATDVAFWVNQLETGETPAELAQSFVASNEYRANQINQLYEQYLGRAADTAGINYWTGVWNETGGPEHVQAGIIGSPEFLAAAQKLYQGLSADAAWVTALYHDLLNRDATTKDLSYWVGYLQSFGAGSVVLAIVTSDEFRLDLINNDFQTYLGRQVDQPSAQAFLADMKDGLTQDQLISIIVSSQEYINKP